MPTARFASAVVRLVSAVRWPSLLAVGTDGPMDSVPPSKHGGDREFYGTVLAVQVCCTRLYNAGRLDSAWPYCSILSLRDACLLRKPNVVHRVNAQHRLLADWSSNCLVQQCLSIRETKERQ